MDDLLTLLQRSLDELASRTSGDQRPKRKPKVPSISPPPRTEQSTSRRLPVDEDTIFATLDVETTGIYRYDRVIEIAVLRVRRNGETLEEFSTLVNPDRDLGPLHIHGISARDLAHAPSFEDVAGDILAMLEGAVMVAHNVRFDLRFVRIELERLGIALPVFPYLCTMQLAREARPDLARCRLSDVCRCFEIPQTHEHQALQDARVTSKILIRCMACIGSKSLPVPQLAPLSWDDQRWPSRPRSRHVLTRTEAAQAQASQPSFIAQLVEKLPALRIPDHMLDSYIGLLDRALEDRRIHSDEAEALYELAIELGMSREQAELVHKIYLTELMIVALEDEDLTEAELADLEDVRRLLGITDSVYKELFRQESMCSSPLPKRRDTRAPELAGKRICFSGTLLCKIEGERPSRETAQQIAFKHGLIVSKNVTREVDFLVLSDPDSMSGKAKAARRYGVRILAERVFWRWMRIQYE